MKLIENFAELLHQDQLPENFCDWFVMEENESEKELKLFSGRFSSWYVKDTFDTYKTKFKFYRKDRTKKDLERQRKLLEDIPVFPYFSNLAHVWDRRNMYESCKRTWDEMCKISPETGNEEYLKSFFVEEIFPKRFMGSGNEFDD